MNRIYWIFILVSLFFSGCASSIGPPTISRDRFDYTTAISDSWKKQTLLNIVKIRYMDMPVFVDVASVIGGYTLSGSVAFGELGVPADAQPYFKLGGGGSFEDRPTITYAPVRGKEFTKSFMTPIPPAVVLFLMQNGWPVDLIMPLTVDSINGLRSQISGGANQRLGDPEFYRVIETLRELQVSGEAGIQIQRSVKKVEGVAKETTMMSIQRKNIAPDLKAALSEVDELLGLRPGLEEIKVSYGRLPEDDNTDDEIAMLTRSMLSILIQLAFQVDVPTEHVTEGRTVSSVEPSRFWGTELGKLIEVHHGISKPAHAFTSAKYRDLWFWIDDRDFKSKRTFLFVMILFSLSETGGTEGLPLVTIPAG